MAEPEPTWLDVTEVEREGEPRWVAWAFGIGWMLLAIAACVIIVVSNLG